MTDDERRNRNPAPEVETITRKEFEAKYPRLRVSDLEPGHVYVLESSRHIVTMNYMGPTLAVRVDGDGALAGQGHVFEGPRSPGMRAILAPTPDGAALIDMVGNVIILRQYTGPDA